MEPVKYHEPNRFYVQVWLMSAFPAESWAVTMERLEEAIRRDAEKLGVAAEMSPERVVYAYRHHRNLSMTREQAMEEWRRRMSSRDDLPVDHPLVIGEPLAKEWPDEKTTGMWMKLKAREDVYDGVVKTEERNDEIFRIRAGWLNDIEREYPSLKMFVEVGQREALQYFRSVRKLLKELAND